MPYSWIDTSLHTQSAWESKGESNRITRLAVYYNYLSKKYSKK